MNNVIGVTWPFDEWNLNFLRDYAGIEMPKRVFEGSEDDTSFIPDPSLIKSGDTFQILRLDGLDPMIAWAMGSATGNCSLLFLDFDSFYRIMIWSIYISKAVNNTYNVDRSHNSCHVER